MCGVNTSAKSEELLYARHGQFRDAPERGAASFDVEILSLATANPSFALTQADAAARAKKLDPHLKRLWPLYDNTGIELRYNCEPIEWYLKPHTWEERTASFHKHALDLSSRSDAQRHGGAASSLSAIDMIVTNTVTGLADPEPRRQAVQSIEA